MSYAKTRDQPQKDVTDVLRGASYRLQAPQTVHKHFDSEDREP